MDDNTPTKPTVLLVEDSETFSRLLTLRIRGTVGAEVVRTCNYSDTAALLKAQHQDFDVALLDLCLPDALEGEIVDLCLKYGIPSVIFTGDFSSKTREFIWSKNVVDYVLKEGPYSLDYVVGLIHRMQRNKAIRILVVDDSPSSRKYIKKLLVLHQYEVLEADGGDSALRMLDTISGIKLALVDHYMPGMSGFELVKRIRSLYGADRLAVVGMSSQNDPKLSAQFLKYGANDFLIKPFVSEQLYCRVIQNISLIERFEEIRDMAYTDYLTLLRNRLYLFEFGAELYKRAKRSQARLGLAIIDADHFKNVNDTYGHMAGDAVLKNIANLLKSHFPPPHLTARFGGEEFCVIAPDLEMPLLIELLDQVRIQVQNNPVCYAGASIPITISIGVTQALGNSFEEMLKAADAQLYAAKAAGRNRTLG